MIDRSKIWTGDLNEKALEPQSHRTIGLYDTTLRDGEQSPGCSMNTREKLEVARALVELGVDVIEAGFPIASPGDFEAVSQIAAKFGDRTTICALARSREDYRDSGRGRRLAAGVRQAPVHQG